MPQTEHLLELLKRACRAKGLTYAEIARRLGVSEPTIKRHFATGNVSLRRLEELCDAAGLSFFDLARMGRASGDQQQPPGFTAEQEEVLATDPQLLAVLYLFLQDWAPQQIVADYELTWEELRRLMRTLDELALIERLPRDQVRVKVERPIRWRPDGPLVKAYEGQAKTEFLNAAFTGQDATASFTTGELSELSRRVLLRRLERLRRDVQEMAEVDATLPKAQTASVGLVVAFRPWVFSVLENLKRRSPV